MQRRAHPLPAFRHRLVGQPDDSELPAAAIGDVHLHIDITGVDAPVLGSNVPSQ